MSKRLLLVFAVLLAAAGFYARYYNHQQAQALVKTVQEADSAGQDTTQQVKTLNDYVKSHMGATVTYRLDSGYKRAQDQARAAATAQAANAKIYADAQRACSSKKDSISLAKCNQDYLAKHLVNLPNPTPVPEPRLADYQPTVTAPLWTPDLAGALLLAALFLVGWVGWRQLRSKR